MILPENGRVIIIDDKFTQALPLISALSKYNIASTFFDAKVETLPNELISDARIVFLDINLNGTTQPNWATDKAMLIGIIEGIIEKNIPFILLIWSVNEKAYFDDVVALFNNELLEYKPIITPIRMEKDELFKCEDPDTDIWVLIKSHEETLEFIIQKITEGMKELDSFEAILKWENIVNSSSVEISNELILTANGNGDLNTELKSIYYKLAESFLGRQMKLDTEQIIPNALLICNDLLKDRLDYNVSNKLDIELIKEIEIPDDFQEKDKAIFNSKLLLSFINDTIVLPGNVYHADLIDIQFPQAKDLIGNSLYVLQVAKEFYEAKTGDNTGAIEDIINYKKSNKGLYGKFEKAIRGGIGENSDLVYIEVSPTCDYAQKKWKMNRICPALLWPAEYSKYIGNSENLYISPIVNIYERDCYIVIDLRYFQAIQFTSLQDQKVSFSLKHSLLVDIQSNLSKHVNRPGISALN